MKKPIIAVDVDDVLADNATGLIAFSNNRWQTNLKIDDYQEHWTEMWGVDHAEVKRRSLELHRSGHMNNYDVVRGAHKVLLKLKDDYRLVITTSRRKIVEAETRAWLDTYYKNIFDEIHFVGIYDGELDEAVYATTKLHAFQRLRVDYVIDDQLKHCLAAAEAGIGSILFGDYAWNRLDDLPQGITRCGDWQEVLGYFNDQKH